MTENAPIQEKTVWRWSLLWVTGLFLLAMRPIEAFDTFWQLQAGKYIWQTGAFLYRDTFSLAADAYRMEHCWLHDLILYGLYSTGGYFLLSLLKPVLIALCGGLLLRWAQQRGGNPLVVLPVLTLCLIGSSDSWLVRPQLWTFLLSILILVFLYRGRERGWRSWLWLPPLMLLWANLHAACIFGFALIGAFWVGECWRAWRGSSSWRTLGQLSVCGVLTFAAAFVNPYGYRIPLGELLAHFNQLQVLTGNAPVGMAGNMEWLPPTFAQVPWFYLIMALWGATLLSRLWRRQLEVAELVYFAGFSYMGFSQIRHTTLVALLAGFFLPLAIQELLTGRERTRTWLARPVPWHWLPGLMLLAALVWGAAGAGRLGLGVRADQYPVAAADFVATNRPAANLYNAYDWGGYLMWRLYPDYLVFIDGRSTSPRHFAASDILDNGWEGWRALLDEYGINTIVTRTCFYDSGGPLPLIDGLVQDRDWSLVFQDGVAVVFVRNDAASRELRSRFAIPSRQAYQTMLEEAGRLQEEGYERPRTWLALGWAAFNLGDGRRALDAYRHFLGIVPTNLEAQSRIALLQRLYPGGEEAGR
ncbi:hypothetical protein [Desulfuromonas sp. DDH964]|uniref:hypothetical protein n=1 Tax=Desulfuromonas sp. DDH964 TaxID=1823759 RepID=UPI0012F8F8A0|nr:hypothetical protein [Desulfuromonas sp. DDH964]